MPERTDANSLDARVAELERQQVELFAMLATLRKELKAYHAEVAKGFPAVSQAGWKKTGYIEPHGTRGRERKRVEE